MTPLRIHGRKSGSDKLFGMTVHPRFANDIVMRGILLILPFIFLYTLCFPSEKRHGIVRRNLSIACIYQCDTYYLDPDPSNMFIYLKPDAMTTINLGQYQDAHVEVTGFQAACGFCPDLFVTDIRLLPPVTDAAVLDGPLPVTTALGRSYPNPFNPSTTIQYDLDERTEVTLVIYTTLGSEVARLVSGIQAPGRHAAVWDATGNPDGMYFCRLSVVNASGRMLSFVGKMVYMK